MRTGEYQWSSGLYMLCIDLLQTHIDCVPQSGAADDAIAHLRTLPEISEQLNSLNSETVRKELREYGAWDETELADHNANLSRLLWIAVCDCREQPEWYEVTE